MNLIHHIFLPYICHATPIGHKKKLNKLEQKLNLWTESGTEPKTTPSQYTNNMWSSRSIKTVRDGSLHSTELKEQFCSPPHQYGLLASSDWTAHRYSLNYQEILGDTEPPAKRRDRQNINMDSLISCTCKLEICYNHTVWQRNHAIR